MLGVFLLIIGLFILICTIFRLPFYWNSRKALRMRRLVGDTVTFFLYIIIGAGIGALGLLDILNIVPLK